MKNGFYYMTPIGKIGIAEQDGKITNLFFGKTVHPDHFEVNETPVLKAAAGQIAEYFDKKRTVFDLPLAPEGTEFEQAVWAALCTIPFGQTRSYRQIAEQIGKPTACRAVGRANGRNPISIIIPCHRVIGTSGKLTGYAGGLELKERLLGLESSL